MSDAAAQALRALLNRVVELVVADETIHKHLEEVIQAYATTAPGQTGTVAGGSSEIPAAPESIPTASLGATERAGKSQVKSGLEALSPDVVSAKDAIAKLTLGRSVADPEAWEREAQERGGKFPHVSDDELSLIEKRCRLKAEAVRWQIERARLLAAGADKATSIEPRDRDLISRAKALPECFLWMNYHEVPTPSGAPKHEQLAGCFEATAEAAALIASADQLARENVEEYEESLRLLAEAQSGLRAAVQEIEANDDNDQVRSYLWLRRTTYEQHVFIQRYMRAGDPADPANWADICRRVRERDAHYQDLRSKHKLRKKLIGNLRYVAQQIKTETQSDHTHNWEKLIRTVDEIVAAGDRPSSRELREQLLPIINNLPATEEIYPANFQLVLSELDQYLAAQPAEDLAPAETNLSAEVRRAAELLRGKSMVLIGGERRRPQEQAIIKAFELKDLLWAAAREHESISKFEPFIANPDVAVVLLAIRWSSHSYGEVKEFCDRYGKLMVRLPGGYNPNQLANQILSQVGDRLTPVSGT